MKNGNLMNLKFKDVSYIDKLNIIQMDDGIVGILNIDKRKMYLLDIKENDYEIVQSYDEFNFEKLFKLSNIKIILIHNNSILGHGFEISTYIYMKKGN